MKDRAFKSYLSGIALAVLLATPCASASVARALTLVNLIRASQVVAVVTPVSEQVVGSRPAELMRKVAVRVDECVTGECATQLHVYLRGGQRDGVVKVVPGEASLVVGKQMLLFLRRDGSRGPWQIAGLSQGAFEVFEKGSVAKVRRLLGGVSLVNQCCDQSSTSGAQLACAAVPFEDRLDLFVARVRSLAVYKWR
ncbi:MAG: hypothetical protein MUC50_10225 [Myxococcota bacterium]|jgi:hypothetical protein|nr:hypothetical protein [Myxococcota bacterium]